jgi:hypothetical protein
MWSRKIKRPTIARLPMSRAYTLRDFDSAFCFLVCRQIDGLGAARISAGIDISWKLVVNWFGSCGRTRGREGHGILLPRNEQRRIAR